MKYGLFGINQDALIDPDAAAETANAAESAGYDSLWVGEHVVLPDPHVDPSPMLPEDPILDPIVSLSFLAAHTKKLLLATGVIILPQRNPLVLAKELVSLDIVSRGRLIFGIGVGYLEPEMKAVGVPMEHRGTRADEYLAAILALWTHSKPAFKGRFIHFNGIQAYPRPIQRPRIPIIVGGRTPAAHRRAVRYADGWYGFNLSLEETAQQIEGLRAAKQQYVRDSQLGKLEVSVTPRGQITFEDSQSFSKLGVDRLILRIPRSGAVDDALKFIRSTSTEMKINL